ncbi:MAG: HDOD domain-containing protein [Phycisphaerae bacterium]|nr:HDOD domain-containing protein [Phycisphaerae bacterium]
MIFGHLEQLPALPAVATHLLQILSSETINAAGITAIIETFQGIEPQSGSVLDRAEFWKHSLAVGYAAKLIAERMGQGKRKNEAFVCGLLHDIGKIALDACLPKSYGRVLLRTRATGGCLCDVERELLGIDHTIAGKRLATRWKLPQAIVDTIWLHHQPPAALPLSLGSGELVGIVHLADQMVRHEHIGHSGYTHLDPLGSVADAVGLDAAEVPGVLEALPAEMERNCQLVGIEEVVEGGLHAKAVSQANVELGRVNARLTEANRRLKARACCFDALGRFTRSLSLDDAVATVCLAVARCVREVLDVEAAVGFYWDRGGGLYQVGVCEADGERTEVLPRPAGDSLNGLTVGGRFAVVGGVIGPAASLAKPVMGHLEGMLGAGSVQMWPVMHAGVVIGGVLFRSDNGVVQRFSSSAEEFEALGVAFGLSVAGAAGRARSDRLNEELADANRRLHEARGELLRTRSIAMIAEMAAGAAHELNNPLAVISGRAQMLGLIATDPEQKRTAEIIHQQAQRASNIVSELVQFSKPDRPKPVCILLSAWFDNFRRECEERSSLRQGQLRVKLSDSAVRVWADPAQLRRIFDALLANAIEATIPENARLLINSASTSSDDRIVVTVEDNGVGMTREVLDHAIDPFFSHRAAGRGRGMGLSQAARLTTNNGGRLWLESTLDVGTTVFVELPAAR